MDLLEGITERRAIQSFDASRDVPDETLFRLLEIAALAPSSFNLQPWEVIVVRDKGQKKLLRKCAMNQPKVEEAPVVLVLLGNLRALETNSEEVVNDRLQKGYLKDASQKETVRKVMYQLYGEPQSPKRLAFAAKNVGLYAMTFMLAARAYGLETHPMDGFDSNCVVEHFEIPDGKIVLMLIALGYPNRDFKLLDRPTRFPTDRFCRAE